MVYRIYFLPVSKSSVKASFLLWCLSHVITSDCVSKTVTLSYFLVGDTNRQSCEPQGIPQKGLQIECVVAIYVNDVKCKLAHDG